MNYAYLACVGAVVLGLFAWSAWVYFRQIFGSGITAQDWETTDMDAVHIAPVDIQEGVLSMESVGYGVIDWEPRSVSLVDEENLVDKSCRVREGDSE